MNIELAQRVTEQAILAATSFSGFCVGLVLAVVFFTLLARS